MSATEVFASRRITKTRSQSGGYEESRTRVFIVDDTPEVAVLDSQIPKVGHPWNTENEYNANLLVTNMEAERVEGVEDGVTKTQITLQYKASVGTESDEDSEGTAAVATWERDISWTLDIGTASEKIKLGKRSRPLPNRIQDILVDASINPCAYVPVGKNGEGTSIVIPKVTLSITRPEPNFPEDAILNLTGSINSNNNWVFSGDNYNWMYMGASASYRQEGGADVTHKFDYAYNGHHKVFTATRPSEDGTQTLLCPLDVNGNPLAYSGLKEVPICGRKALVPSTWVAGGLVKYAHKVYVYVEKDFTLFNFWSGTGPI